MRGRERALTQSGALGPDDRFWLAVGGPFSDLLRWLRMTGADRLPAPRAAFGLAMLAWLPPALLAVAQSVLDKDYSGWAYFTDWMVYTRYLVAVWVMVATERYADGRLILLARHFREAQILSDADQPAFRSALAVADRRSSSTFAEGMILALVLVGAGLSTSIMVDRTGTSWEARAVEGAIDPSWAGEAARLLSTPLFLFLVFRWTCRFGVWTALLRNVSRLPLQLMPLHPDRSGGFGFLTIYPSIFNGFIFALSAVIASAMVTDIGLEHHSAQTVWLALVVWVGLCVMLVVGPLLVFVPQLHQMREKALVEYGRLASQHDLAFHRKWIVNTIV